MLWVTWHPIGRLLQSVAADETMAGAATGTLFLSDRDTARSPECFAHGMGRPSGARKPSFTRTLVSPAEIVENAEHSGAGRTEALHRRV
jgi:hypothetical protein